MKKRETQSIPLMCQYTRHLKGGKTEDDIEFHRLLVIRRVANFNAKFLQVEYYFLNF